jgi:hypothetical protein
VQNVAAYSTGNVAMRVGFTVSPQSGQRNHQSPLVRAPSLLAAVACLLNGIHCAVPGGGQWNPYADTASCFEL